jgi:WD40 repeat protein
MTPSGSDSTPYGGHTGTVLAMACAPDGMSVATTGHGGVQIWDTQTGQEKGRLTGHTGVISSIAYAPDSNALATGDQAGMVRIWDIRTGQQQQQLRASYRPIYSLAYAPDGASLATSSRGGMVQIWDTRTGRRQHQLDGHREAVLSVAYSPDGASLATGSEDGVRIWDTRTGRQQQHLNEHHGPVRSVVYAPDGLSLAIGSFEDDGVRIWNTRTGHQQQHLTGHTGPVYSMAYAPDGASLAAGAEDGIIRIWDTRTGRQQRQLKGHTGMVHSVAYDPHGARLATGSGDGVRIWNTRTGQQQHHLNGHRGLVLSVAYSPDGASLATGSEDGVRIWNTRTGQQQHHLNGHRGSVLSVAYSPDGASLATGSEHGAQIWNTRTGQQQQHFATDIEPIQSVAYSSDGASLATASLVSGLADSGGARVWDTRTGRQQQQLTAHGGAIHTTYTVAYAPDGASLATGGQYGVRIWDILTGQQQQQLTAHSATIYSVAYAPRGSSLATGDRHGIVRIWDTRTGQQQQQLTAHSGAVYAVAYAPDGASLATGGEDGIVRIWDTRTGQQQRQLTGHIGSVYSVAYAPDGASLATVGEMTIRIWNPRTGAQVDGTGLGVTRMVGRPLAGVSSDAPSDQDLMASASDVETLADLIAATETSPPLAIALIGDWGAGKSSLMLQIQNRIKTLADMSRNNPGLSVFASNVRQVRFNAWDYSDDQVWSGLIDHLFHALAEDLDDSSAPADRLRVEAERGRLRRELVEQEAEEKRLSSQLRRTDHGAQPEGLLGWLGSPIYAGMVVIAAARLLVEELNRSRWISLAWAVLAGSAVSVWLLWGPKIGAGVAALTGAAAPALMIGQRLWSWHRTGTGAVARLRQRLGQQQRGTARTIADLKQQLALIDASVRLSTFISDRSAATAYSEYRGLLGQVRSDLATLSRELAAAHSEWLAEGAATTPPLERIVLYIDDLDRCPPRRVVEVLEAVHLMLALELFVVVVAVDARWLIQSLKYHYRELFSTNSGPVLVAPVSFRDPGAELETASPVDYLDKIFQIPYALMPPSPEAMASYLGSLMPSSSTLNPTDASVAGHAPGERTTDSQASDKQFGMGQAFLEPDEDITLQQPPGRPPSAARRRIEEYSGAAAVGRAGLPQAADTASAIPRLRPLGLQLTHPEIEFMKHLGTLLPTPRAAKKLVNLYRLVRIGIPDSDLTMFTCSEKGGQYQIVQILLAMLVGHPAAARHIFHDLMEAPPDSDIISVIAKPTATDVPNSNLNARIGFEISKIAEITPTIINTGEYQQWCHKLARYSFYTRTMVAELK